MHLSPFYGAQTNLLLFVNEQRQKMQRVPLHASERTDGGTEQSWWKPEERGEKAGGREVTIRHCSYAARWEICCHRLVWVGCCCQWREIWCSLKKAVVDLRRPPPGQVGHMLPISILSLILWSLTLDWIIQNQNLISATPLVFELRVSITSDEMNHKNTSNELIFQLLNTLTIQRIAGYHGNSKCGGVDTHWASASVFWEMLFTVLQPLWWWLQRQSYWLG